MKTKITPVNKPMSHAEVFAAHGNLIKGRMIMYERMSEHLGNRMIIKRALVVGIDLDQVNKEIRAYLCKDDFDQSITVSKDEFIGYLI